MSGAGVGHDDSRSRFSHAHWSKSEGGSANESTGQRRLLKVSAYVRVSPPAAMLALSSTRYKCGSSHHAGKQRSLALRRLSCEAICRSGKSSLHELSYRALEG